MTDQKVSPGFIVHWEEAASDILAADLERCFAEHGLGDVWPPADTPSVCTPDVIRKTVATVLHQHLLAAHLGGCFYFVLPRFSGTLHPLRSALSAMGLRLYFFALEGNKDNQAFLRESLCGIIGADVHDFSFEIDAFREKLPREDTLQRRLIRCAALQKKASLYAGALGEPAAIFENTLADCQERLQTALGLAQEEKREKKADRKKRHAEYMAQRRKKQKEESVSIAPLQGRVRRRRRNKIKTF